MPKYRPPCLGHAHAFQQRRGDIPVKLGILLRCDMDVAIRCAAVVFVFY